DGFTPFVSIATGFGVLHAAYVVGVGDTHITNTAQNVTGYVAVTTGCLAAQIVFHATQPLFGRFRTIMGNHGSNQGRVVGMLAGADADFAFPFWISEIFVVNAFHIHVLGNVSHTIPQGQGVPLFVSTTQIGGDGAVQGSGLDRLSNTGFNQIQQVTDIHRHQNVGRRLVAFCFHTLDQAVFHKHGIDLHARVLAEGFQQGSDQTRFACGVEVDFAGGKSRHRHSAHSGQKQSLGQGTATKSKAHYQHSKTGGNSVKTGQKPANVNDYQTYAKTRQELFSCQALQSSSFTMKSLSNQENRGFQNLMVS